MIVTVGTTKVDDCNCEIKTKQTHEMCAIESASYKSYAYKIIPPLSNLAPEQCYSNICSRSVAMRSMSGWNQTSIVSYVIITILSYANTYA